jgi:DNA-binding MarR family transcriptional regulator
LDIAYNATLDNIIDDLFYVLPIIHKKLLKLDPSRPLALNLTHLQIGILMISREEGPLPISEIAARLQVSRPQMTPLIGSLVRAGLVEKQPGQRDRRVTGIALTAKGQSEVALCEKYLKDSVKTKLGFLEAGDLADLSAALRKLREIGLRWETRKREKDGIK